MEIPGLDDIRGNISLPDQIEGAAVSWKSSDPSVISDKKQGEKAAGVVSRGSTDKQVTLTAVITKGAASTEKIFHATVKKAPQKLLEDDFTAYLFGSFTGTEGSPMDEQIYFAVSTDGYYYTDLNHCRPVLESHIGERGERDPYLMRSAEGDKFYLLATDLSIYYRGGWGSAKATTTGSRDLIIWESTDLVNWSEPRAVAVGTEDAGCAWAPEAIYNEATGEYVVYFAQSHVIDGALDKDLRIFVTTTRDFISFSEAQEYIYRADDRSIIDTSMILAEDGYYYRASADGQITLERSQELFGEWEKVTTLNDLGFDQDMTGARLEGPELIRFNKKDWIDGKATYGLFTDQYAEGKGYLPVVTTNLNDADNSDHSWKKLPAGEYSFDMLKKRHGTILNLTQSEYERIKEAYGTNNKESVEKPEDGILADFDFDDREKGFTGGIAIAEANGSVRLDAHNDGKALYLDGSTWIPTGSCTRPRTLLHRFTNQSVILVFWLTMGRPQRNATIMTGNGRRIRRQRREIRGFMWT